MEESLPFPTRLYSPRGRILPCASASRRRAIAFFVVLGVCLVLLAVGLNVGWIILNWREGVLLFLGVIFFALLIAGHDREYQLPGA